MEIIGVSAEQSCDIMPNLIGPQCYCLHVTGTPYCCLVFSTDPTSLGYRASPVGNVNHGLIFIRFLHICYRDQTIHTSGKEDVGIGVKCEDCHVLRMSRGMNSTGPRSMADIPSRLDEHIDKT